MVTTPGGVQWLDLATTGIVQVTGALTGLSGLVALGLALRDQLRAGAHPPETQAAIAAKIAAFDAALDAALAVNVEWRATHPRLPDPPAV